MVDGVEAGLRVTAALDFLRSGGGDEMRDHYIWSVKSVLTNMAPEDLSTTALVSILAILIPEHSRFLAGRVPPSGGRPSGKILRIISDDNSAGA